MENKLNAGMENKLNTERDAIIKILTKWMDGPHRDEKGYAVRALSSCIAAIEARRDKVYLGRGETK